MGMRKNTVISRLTVAVLAGSMVFQASALASDEMDELNGILEKQQENAGDSLLEQTLGMSDLGKALAENGFQIQVTGGLLPELEELIGLDEMWQDTNVGLNVQFDPQQKKYQADVTAENAAGSLFDLGIYGDKDQLAVSLPQFYDGALQIKSGNLKEQYESSALAQLIGTEDAEIPDIDLSFYPEGGEGLSSITDGITQWAEEIQNNTEVVKSEEGDEVIYTLNVKSEDIIDLYRQIFDAYFEMADAAEAAIGDVSDLSSEMDQVWDEMEKLLSDDIAMNFIVKDDLLQKITYSMEMDLTELGTVEDDVETVATEIEADALDEAGDAADASSEDNKVVVSPSYEFTDVQKVLLDYEISFADPQNLNAGFTFDMQMATPDQSETLNMTMNYLTETEDTTEKTTLDLEMKENDEILYSGTPYTMTFDASTGAFDVELSFTDPDSEDTVAFALNGTFSDVEKGKSFVFTLDNVSLSAEDEEISGLTGSLSVSADPGTIEAPANTRAILEMEQQDLISLLTEISTNAQTWAAQFMPEDETEYYDQQILDETEGGAMLTSVIGGADGPTAVFLAGKTAK